VAREEAKEKEEVKESKESEGALAGRFRFT